ncbi:tyrosine-type recombinase/integrase [Undibacterium sp. SXout7W]|uniref:tyrosine-type recombinase/integrase n=1 Tax=Undibacterium sp. SXout7W TaxID=3413049 RepID=UPI003BEF506E
MSQDHHHQENDAASTERDNIQRLASSWSESRDNLAIDRILQRAGRHHFAFFRAYLEGLDQYEMAKRYLENATTTRISSKEIVITLQWIRKDLSVIAKRHGKFAFARIINIEPEQLKPISTVEVPSLDAYREERDPYEMYSEADLIELFQEEFGDVKPDPRQQRKASLLRKQNEALNWLEAKVAIAPLLQDPVDAWIIPAVAHRLMSARIDTVGALLNTINQKGHLWYRHLNQVGEVTAAHLVKWLQLYEKDLGQSVSTFALVKHSELDVAALEATRPKEFGIVPLEYFLPDPSMDGSVGENRAERNRSGVNNDYDAIQLWLKLVENNANTYRNYRKEAERFLLWSVLERGKPLSSLMADDCIAYKSFLNDLGRLTPEAWCDKYRMAQDHWLGKRNTQRWSPQWRPFENPVRVKKSVTSKIRKKFDGMPPDLSIEKIGVLSSSSQKQAITIVKMLCETLVRQRYLDSNPFETVKASKYGVFKADATRSFTEQQWNFLIGHLETYEKNSRYFRLRFILTLAYETGMRLSEMAAARVEDVKSFSLFGTSDFGYQLQVLGKGNKLRDVALSYNVIQELNDYLSHRGITSYQNAPAETPLINVIPGYTLYETGDKGKKTMELRRPERALSSRRIFDILKAFFVDAAYRKAKESKEDARHMHRASTHWLRHTCGSHAIANGVPVQIIQDQFGHASIDTTTIYVTTERDNKFRAFNRFSEIVNK